MLSLNMLWHKKGKERERERERNPRKGVAALSSALLWLAGWVRQSVESLCGGAPWTVEEKSRGNWSGENTEETTSRSLRRTEAFFPSSLSLFFFFSFQLHHVSARRADRYRKKRKKRNTKPSTPKKKGRRSKERQKKRGTVAMRTGSISPRETFGSRKGAASESPLRSSLALLRPERGERKENLSALPLLFRRRVICRVVVQKRTKKKKALSYHVGCCCFIKHTPSRHL